MQSTSSFSQQELENNFGSKMVAEARGRQWTVKPLEQDEQKMVAEVTRAHGAKASFRVEIHINRDRGGARHIGSICSCKAVWKCEHAVAVLLSQMEAGSHERQQTGPSEEVAFW
ncbi:MAG: hypothetical protein RIQ52_922, partial [Pseudomonadota bacterium]